MNAVDFLAIGLARVIEGEARDASRSFFGDDLQTLHHPRNHFVFDPRVESLSIFAHDDQIDVRVASGNMRKILNRSKVGKQFKSLAQLNVDARKAAAYRRGHRTLQSDPGALDGLIQFFWDVFPVALERLGSGHERFPLELDASGFENADGCLGDLRPNAVARDESDAMGHEDFVPAS